MLLSLLSIAYIFRVVACVMLEKMSWSCEQSEFFSTMKVNSLIHCAIMCISDDDCRALTFKEGKMICRLHSVQAPCCKGSTTEGSISFQKKVHSCEFETIDAGGYISLEERCGQSFFQPLVVFRVKGTGTVHIDMFDDNGNNYLIRLFETRFLDLSYVNKFAYVVMHGAALDPGVWFYYWVALTNYPNGTTKLHLGQNEMPGCNTILKRYDGIYFIINSATVNNVHASSNVTWTFYENN